MKKRIWIPAVLSAVLLSGCGMQQGEVLKPAAGTQTAEADARLADDVFTSAEYRFSLELLRSTLREKENENIMLSPYSVLYALGMTVNGAAGQTRTEAENLLIGSGHTVDELNEYLYGWRVSHPQEDEACKLHTANCIWINEKIRDVKDTFLQQNQNYYAAEIRRAAFDGAALRDINGFVKRETDSMVPKILDELDPAAMLVLVNAVCFDAQWAVPYEKAQIESAVFHNADGRKAAAEMMTGQEFSYLEQDGAVGFLKDYNGRYAFAGILPPENVSVQEWLDAQTGESLISLIAGRRTENVTAVMPSFSADTSVQLETVLPGLGMPAAFSDSADFSALSDERLKIDEVVHKTHIEVGAQGTKAAAATAVVMSKGATEVQSDEKKTVRLDRPFVYMILDMTNELPVFIGTVQGL